MRKQNSTFQQNKTQIIVTLQNYEIFLDENFYKTHQKQ